MTQLYLYKDEILCNSRPESVSTNDPSIISIDKIISDQAAEIKLWRKAYDCLKIGYDLSEAENEAAEIGRVRENGNRAIENLWKTIDAKAAEIRRLKDRLAIYDATDIPEMIAENKRLKENYIKGQLYIVQQIIVHLKYREQDIAKMLESPQSQKGQNDGLHNRRY